MFGTNNKSSGFNTTKFVKLVLISGLAVAISACGGGGGGGSSSGGTSGGGGNPGGGGGNPGGGGSAPYNNRIADAVMDFDNNGQMDARFDFVYYADGRIDTITYTYTGDGTPDIYNPYYTASVTQADTVFRYDANGALAGLSITIQDNTLGTNSTDSLYTLTNNQMVQADTTVTSPNVQPFTITSVMTYTNGLPSLFASTASIGTSFDRTYTFNANNQVTQSVFSFAGSTNPTTSVYAWNADGSLDKISYSDSNSSWVDDLTFLNGQLVRRDYTFSNPPTNPGNTNVAWILNYNNGIPSRMDYDLNIDGSIDGNEVLNYESAPCTPVYLYRDLDISQAGGDGIPGSPVGVSWCG